MGIVLVTLLIFLVYSHCEVTAGYSDTDSGSLTDRQTETKADGRTDGFVSSSLVISLSVFDATALQWARSPSVTRFLDHTQRPTAVSRTPLD